MRSNRMREILAGGGIPLGHMLMEFGTRGIAKILESANLDFVVVDMEHTGFDAERIADLMAWFKATTVTPFVRIPQTQYHFISRTMDAGAMGIMAPNVESAGQARSLVEAVKFAPMGRRGVGLGTAHTDYVVPDPVEYFRWSNETTSVICQIESTEGLANLEAIASTEGVDVLWVGHFDLSQSLGAPGQFHHPQFLEGLRQVVEAARRYGKAAGIQPGNSLQADEWMQLGFNVISWGADMAVYRGALADAVAALREREATYTSRR